MLITPGDIGLSDNTNGRIGMQSLFSNGEDGYLFRNFSDLTKVYTLFSGQPPVALDGSVIGLALDESKMIGKTLVQATAPSPELRTSGVTGLIGTATAATYNSSTGEATVTRAADGSNQSYVTVPVTAGDVYLIDVTNINAGSIVRDTVTGAVSYTFSVVGGRRSVVVRAGTNTLFFQAATNGVTISFVINSVKKIPGNHAVQSAGSRRPTWNAPSSIKANVTFDGFDDALIPTFRPMVSGTGLTMAVAFLVSDVANTQRIIMGGGDATNRAFIALTSAGTLGVGWGSQINRGGTPQDLRNGWHVAIVTGEGSNRSIWLDGKNVTSDFAAASGTPGTAGPIVIAGRQTSVGGAVDQNMPGTISSILTLDRRVSEKEINLITTEFRNNFTTPVTSLVSKLFSSGENGYYYGDFNQTNKLFTQPGSGVNAVFDTDPIGLALDESQWGGLSINQVLLKQPNLTTPGSWLMSNGGGTSTAVESPAGVLTLVSDGSGARGDFQMTTVANATYCIDISISTSAVSVLVGTDQGFSSLLGVSPNPGTYKLFFTPTGTTTWIRIARNAAGTAVAHEIKVRLVPGNRSIQTVTTRRPSWRAISDIQTNLQFDGVDDALLNSFRPMATGTGFTMATAFYSIQGATQASPMGGGSSVGPSRAYICILANGVLSIGWGSQINRGGAVVDLRNGWHTVIVTGEGSNRDIWLDGVNITSQFASAVGTPGNGPMAIGARQNESGSPDLWFPGNVSAALVLDRRVTQSEINDINLEFKRTYIASDQSLVSSLFGAGEDGYLYGNFRQQDRLFLLSSGGANVTVDNEQVGVALDNHSWGLLNYSQQMNLQPNIAPAFAADGSGWTVTGNDGTHIITFGANSMRYQSDTTSPVLAISRANALVVGQFYEITVNATNYVSGSLKIDSFGGIAAVVSSALGTKKTVFQALGTTLQIIRNSTNVDITISSITLKAIPGNHAYQNVSADRLYWRYNPVNIFAPIFQSIGGAADAFLTQFYPFASGSGLTMAAAFNAYLASSIVIGGGNTTTNNRATMGLQSNGQMSVGWGTEIAESIAVDRRNQNLVMIVTGDVTGRTIWLNGQNVTSLFATAVGVPNNTGGALAIGGRQNSTGGTTDRNLGGNIFAALALNRRVTTNEIARINAAFQSTFAVN